MTIYELTISNEKRFTYGKYHFQNLDLANDAFEAAVEYQEKKLDLKTNYKSGVVLQNCLHEDILISAIVFNNSLKTGSDISVTLIKWETQEEPLTFIN